VAHLDDDALANVLTLVRRRLGLDPEPLRENLRSAVLERSRKCSEPAEQYAWGLSSRADQDSELAALAGRLLLGHTHFYRHQGVWEWLAEHLSEMVTGGKIKALVAGCSTGEEAYTLGAMLASTFGENNIEVTGIDVNSSAIQTARNGMYGERETTKLPEAWRHRYLERMPGGFVRFVGPLRTRVRFEWANIRQRLPRGSFHLVMLRNVMTYLVPEAVSDVLDRIEKALIPPAILVVAPQETYLLRDRGKMQTVGGGLPIFQLGKRTTVPVDRGLTDLYGKPPTRGSALVSDQAAGDVGVAPALDEPMVKPDPLTATDVEGWDFRATVEQLSVECEEWKSLQHVMRALLSRRATSARIDLTAVKRVDFDVQRSMRAASRLLAAIGCRIEVRRFSTAGSETDGER
jgi:chemotaxis methyl-accepting protein methylase